jgi:hypothetical protein
MKMKQIKFAGAAMAAALMLLTSCLGETGNSGQLGMPGRFTYSNGKMLIDTYFGMLYASQTSTLAYDDGDWAYVNFAFDMETPENVNWEANGYITVTLLTAPTKISEGVVAYSSDTTKAMDNEITLLQGIYITQDLAPSLRGGDFMFASAYTTLKDQETSFMVYYDYTKEPVASDNLNTYTLYVRAIRAVEGKEPKSDMAMPYYYNMESILNTIYSRERAANKEYFNFAIRHVSEIDEETGELTWKSNSPITLGVPSIAQ